MEKDLEKTLINAGRLSRNEAKVYLALVKIGNSKAGKVSKEAAIDRTSTYNSLKGLMEKGLVSYVTIGKVKWFQACEPRNLKIYLSNKLEELSEAIPELEKQFASKKTQNNVRLFKGLKGVKNIFNSVLEDREENCVFGSEQQLEKFMPAFAAKFKLQLLKKDIKTRNIVRKGRDLKENKVCKVRFIEQEVESPVATNIFGNKIGIIIWSEVPEAILIENEVAAKAYREYFNFMWENAKK